MVWDRESGVVGRPDSVRAIHHAGAFFKVRGPLNTPPLPQGRPVILQAGASPRGIQASARVADVVFGAAKSLELQALHRRQLDAALAAEGRDPGSVGIMWDILLTVAEISAEAKRQKERLLDAIPLEAAGAFISHHAGYDFSTLPPRFSLKELNERIAATQASPVGFVWRLTQELGEAAEMTSDEFFRRGLMEATGYNDTEAGSAAEVADRLEEIFEATGERGGFMVAHPQSTPRDLLNVVDFLVPELRRRGRFRDSYEARTLRGNLLG
jgi:alkanesulfonate monooxygenase SsuD/methylene tetrahydromethanopterin reductase-like flavin-dependent oxidoreductase (luciferase family)